MNSPRATFLLVALLGLGGMAALLMQYRTNASLHAEIATLRNELQAAQVARPPIPATANSAADPTLVAMRDDLRALNERVQDLSRASTSAKPAATPTSGGTTVGVEAARTGDGISSPLPKDAWANLGSDTPRAALQTALWAAAHGELDTLARNMTFDPAARAKADALFASLPDATRSQFGSPEQFMALVLSDEINKITSLQVLRETKSANDQANLQVVLPNNHGGYKVDNFPMQRGPTGWQLLVPVSAVDGVAKTLAGKTDGK